MKGSYSYLDRYLKKISHLRIGNKNQIMIRKLSKKRAKQNRIYLRLREKFLENNPICQAGLKGCTIQATEVHHTAGRIGLQLINTGNFLAVCHSCHTAIENNPVLAKENGHSKSRHYG